MKKIISILIILFALILSYFYFNKSDKVVVNKITTNKNTNNENINNNKNINTAINNYKYKIIAIGDSLTAGYGLPIEESYPNQLEDKLLKDNYSVNVINSGISGETTAGLLERIDFVLKQSPNIILITIGGNDALRGLQIETIRDNINKIMNKLTDKLSPKDIFVMRIQAPLNNGLSYRNQFNNIYDEVAEKWGVNVLDFITLELFSNNKYMSEDRIHPNKEGYRFIIDEYIYYSLKNRLSR